MTLLPCTALLFDCDGVLVDSDASILNSWTRWAHQLGLDPTKVISYVHGRRAADTVALFVAPSERADALALIDAIEVDDAKTVTPILGASELLATLPRNQWAIVTSAVPDLALARLGAAGLPLPNVLVTGADVTDGKPHPQGYRTGARLLGIPPTQCIVLEDAVPGIRAGRSAGAGFVVGVGNRPFGADQPDVIVTDLRALRWTADGLEAEPTPSPQPRHA